MFSAGRCAILIADKSTNSEIIFVASGFIGGINVSSHFWIAMPIDDFFCCANQLMKKYNVSAYVELIGDELGNRNVYVFQENTPYTFIKYFFEPTYHSFYFSCYPFGDIKNPVKFGTFYSPEIAPFTIEGNGGYETDKTREQIYLRQLWKQPDKNIQRFYLALQRKLKTLPGMQNGYVMGKHEYKNLYYLPSSKKIIPNNPHNRDVKGTWEEYYLNYLSDT